MTYGDVLAILFIHVGFLIAFQSYWLAGAALFPELARSAERNYAARPIKLLLVGLAVAVPLLLLTIAVNNTPVKFAKVVLAGGWLLLGMTAMFGTSGLARLIGSRLPGEPELAIHSTRASYRGGLVLGFTFIMPLLGWFLVIPYSLLSGLGAVAVYRSERRRARGGPASASAMASAGSPPDSLFQPPASAFRPPPAEAVVVAAGAAGAVGAVGPAGAE